MFTDLVKRTPAVLYAETSSSVSTGWRLRKTCAAAIWVVSAIGVTLAWQTPAASAQFATRTEQIQAEREAKRSTARPERVAAAESRLNAVEDRKILERLAFGYHGLTLVLGGLENGQGFALGPQYLRTDLADGNVNIRSSARYAFSNAYFGDAVLGFPHLINDRAFLEFSGTHRNYPRIDYYGPGPDSSRDKRTHFRLEDTAVDATAGVRPSGALSLGLTGGALFINTGPGNLEDEDERPRTEDVFDATVVPGLDRQTDFLKAGAFVQFDYRDNPAGARSGGNYEARFTHFDDRKLGQHDFRQLDLEAQQYIPFFAKRRVIVLRAKTVMTFTNGSATVPFYMQPVLGGSDDLRGYRPFRFHDDNMIVTNIEYRWESFSGLDMALFFDAGKVTSKRSDIDFRNLETAAGIGFRFNVRNQTFIRLDTGFSQEGVQLWFKFASPF